MNLALHMADDLVLPYNVSDYATALSDYVTAVASGSKGQVSFIPLYNAVWTTLVCYSFIRFVLFYFMYSR